MALRSSKIVTEWCVANRTCTINPLSMLSQRVAANIKRMRETKGLSQDKLAKMCEPTTVYQQIDKLETGERRLTLDWVERIAKALGVGPLQLIGGEASAWQTNLNEQVAAEVGRTLAKTILDGQEPDADTVEALALMLVGFAGIFRRYPQALTDPEIARPILDFAAEQYGRRAS